MNICNCVKTCYFNIFVLFIVDTTSFLKLVFPTVYCICLDGYFGGCVVAIIVTVVVVVVVVVVIVVVAIYLFIYFIFLFFSFIYLFIYLLFYLFIYLFFSANSSGILSFVVDVIIATVAFVAEVTVAFCACLVIVVDR